MALTTIFGPYYEIFLLFVVVSLFALIGTIFFSFQKGGFKEVGENLLLWFLLFAAFSISFTYPVSDEDQIGGAIMFVAFGVCRIAKHSDKKT